MKTNCKIFLILILISTSVRTQWQQTNGPLGGTVLSMLQHGAYIFAGTKTKGIYLSSNNGDSWFQTFAELSPVNDLTFNTNNLFAACSTGVYRSTNEGLNWVRILNENAYEIDASGVNIYVGTLGHGIFVSSNNGVTWTNPEYDLPVVSISASENEVYAGIANIYITPPKLIYSSNYGQNWNQIPNYSFFVTTILISDSTVFVGTVNQGIQFTTNKGVSWNNTSITNKNISFIKKKDNLMFAGIYEEGIYLSSDNGLTWMQTSLTSRNFRTFVNNGNTLFAGSDIYGIYRSDDNGLNWERNRFMTHSISSIYINEIGIFAGSHGNYGVDSGMGVYLSTNNGQNWNSILSNRNVQTLTGKNTDLFAGTLGGAGLYYSSNNGFNWAANPLNLFVFGIDVFESDILVGAHNGSGWQGVFLSTDYGTNWVQTSLNKTTSSFLRHNGYILTTAFSNVYISSNGGLNWNPSTLNSLGSTALVSCYSNVLVAANNGVYISTNNGTSWIQSLYSQDATSLAVIDSMVFAGTSTGVFASTNGGYNWSLKNEGMENINVSCLAINDGIIYAGTSDNSIWKRTLSNIIKVEVETTDVPVNFSLSQNYPNPFNPQTKIKFGVPKASFTKLIIYDLLGREVATLVNEELSPGTYEADWDASSFSSGVYFYKIVSGEFVETKKMVLMK